MSLQRMVIGLMVALMCGTVASGQGRGRGGFTGASANPATLLFREAWTRAPMAQPMTQENLGNQHLRLHVYGNPDEIRKTFHPDEDYTYTGEATTNWALTVSDPKVVWDLSGDGRVRFRTRNSGYRFLHVVIRTADGAYFVSEQGAGESTAWIDTDFILSNLTWRNLLMTDTPTNASNRRSPDPKRVPIIPTSRATPDLTRVNEVGFSDLMAGGWIPATSRVQAFELWGKAVPR
ncbi:MAG: hypothetical protein IT183_01385 [Acidobacteria bacterium]|nr:hypothetical protein [Acidobacteriota bacterium]